MKKLRPRLELTGLIYFPLSIATLSILFFYPQIIPHSIHGLHAMAGLFLLVVMIIRYRARTAMQAIRWQNYLFAWCQIISIQLCMFIFFTGFSTATNNSFLLQENTWGLYSLIGIALGLHAAKLNQWPLAHLLLKPLAQKIRRPLIRNILLWTSHFYTTQNIFFWLTLNLSVLTLFGVSQMAQTMHLPFSLGITFFNLFITCALFIGLLSQPWLKLLRQFGSHHAVIQPIALLTIAVFLGIFAMLLIVKPIQPVLNTQTIAQQWLLHFFQHFSENPHYAKIMAALWWFSATPLIARFYAIGFKNIPPLACLLFSGMLPVVSHAIPITLPQAFSKAAVLISLIGLILLLAQRDFQSLFFTRFTHVLEKKRSWYLPLRGLTHTLGIAIALVLITGSFGVLLLLGFSFLPFFIVLGLFLIAQGIACYQQWRGVTADEKIE